MLKRIDLHIHTNCSDGAMTPKDIIDEAVKNGVSILSIADHDTVDAYSDELFQYAKSKNILIIPAVEISTKIKKCGIHVLGYNFDLHNKTFLDKLKSLRNARHDYLYGVAAKLEELGYVVHTSELDKIEAVTKAHISLDVVNNPDNKEKLLEVFGHIPEKGEFIETIMNEGCPAYVKKNTVTPVEAAELIRLVGGKVVLAHPVAYKYEDNFMSEDTLRLVQEMHADGIEANYIYIDKNNNKINEVNFWNEFAKEHKLKATIGSDFHNKDGLHPVIGFKGEDIRVDEKYIDNLVDWLLN